MTEVYEQNMINLQTPVNKTPRYRTAIVCVWLSEVAELENKIIYFAMLKSLVHGTWITRASRDVGCGMYGDICCRNTVLLT